MVEASHLAARSGPTAVVDKTKIFIRRKSTSLSADFQHHRFPGSLVDVLVDAPVYQPSINQLLTRRPGH
jgi:hypothetical protein